MLAAAHPITVSWSAVLAGVVFGCALAVGVLTWLFVRPKSPEEGPEGFPVERGRER